MKIEISVNGESHTLETSPVRRLLDVLRLDLGLTGTKEGCGEGECGACTVLLDGDPVNACLIPIVQVQGHEITTIEGLAADETAQAVQTALVNHGGTQCGFCTPGITLSAVATLRRGGEPSRAELRGMIAGNLCRCTGYQLIIDALDDAAQRLADEPTAPGDRS